jgi:hypothetical protein
MSKLLNRASRPVPLPTLTTGRRPNPQAICLRHVPVPSPAKAQIHNLNEARNTASKPALRQPTSATASRRLARRMRDREDAWANAVVFNVERR